MGMNSSKSRKKSSIIRDNRSINEQGFPDFLDRGAIVSPPLTSRINSDIEWDLKFANYKVETLETELENCKQRIKDLEDSIKKAVETLEEYKEYKIKSEFYIKQIEDYQKAAGRQEEMYFNLRKEYEEKCENYRNQLKKYKNSIKSLQKYENLYKIQQVSHRMDLLDLERTLLEEKINILIEVPNCDVNIEIEKDRARLQSIYDEAFMEQKYIPDGESSDYATIESKNCKKERIKNLEVAKKFAYLKRGENQVHQNSGLPQILNFSGKEAKMKRSFNSSHSSVGIYHMKTRSLYPNTESIETCDTEYEPK